MAKKKLKVVVLFGGKSAEHEVSISSAKNVIAALDHTKYKVIPVKIEKSGKFNSSLVKNADVVFPVLHGPFGEDGTIQGLLKLSEVPFIGAGVLGSALGMDKDFMKRIFRDAGVATCKFMVLRSGEKVTFADAKKLLGMPMFIKPANMGSSVGVHKVKNEVEFYEAIKHAFGYDSKILIEEAINGREIECSVLGNEDPMASMPGEIKAGQEFYSYDAKYVDEGSVAEIPAKLDKKTIEKVQKMAIKAYKAVGCEGMGRVDFFVKNNGEVLVNEINTIPGFTNISMYPKMWEASGMPLKKLLDKLISLAIERFKREQKLKTSFK